MKPENPRKTEDIARASLQTADASEHVEGVSALSAGIVYVSEGQRLLAEIKDSSAHIGKVIGEARQRVTEWRAGAKKPSAAPRAMMQAKLGIPSASWSMLPAGMLIEGAAAPTIASPYPKAAKVELLSSLEEANALLVTIKTAISQPGLAPSEQMKLSDTMSRVLTLRSKLERENELLESRIVAEHPSFRRYSALCRAALEPYPAALKAVLDAMKKAAL